MPGSATTFAWSQGLTAQPKKSRAKCCETSRKKPISRWLTEK